MTPAQHQFFNQTIQRLHEARADLHDAAWTLLGLMLLIAIFALAALGLWLLQGGLSQFSGSASAAERKLLHEWLRE